jgi:hypothetical protein
MMHWKRSLRHKDFLLDRNRDAAVGKHFRAGLPAARQPLTMQNQLAFANCTSPASLPLLRS